MNDEQRLFEDFHNLIADPFINIDLLRLICGRKLGSGSFRAVYDANLVKNAVVKVAPTCPRANIVEYQIWQSIKTEKSSKWFAPCYDISPGGHILIQKRVRPISAKDKLPKILPQFFTDIKRDNFGFIGKQLVCHDYQFITRALDYSMQASRKIDWNALDTNQERLK